MGSLSCTGMRIWPADCSSGIHITNGSSGTVPWRCSHARSDSVHAASNTLVTSPPKAVLTVSRSACHTEANATARRSVNGAVNALSGSGPRVDGTAGAADSSSATRRVPPSCPRTERSKPVTVSATRNRPLNWNSRISVITSAANSPTAGMAGLGCLGLIVAAPCCGSERNSRDQMDAAPTPRSLSSGDSRTTSAHRPPDRPSRVHASQSISL